MATKTVPTSKARGKRDTRKTPAKKQTRMQRFAPHLPFEDFPLFPHQSGRWAKKINGKLCYYGKVSDGWETAKDAYDLHKDDDHAGRTRRTSADGMTVGIVCVKFLEAKKRAKETGQISDRTYDEYVTICTAIEDAFGARRQVGDLSADDFGRFRTQLAMYKGKDGKRCSRSPVVLSNMIQRVRTVFKTAYEDGLIDKPMRFGSQFKKPTRKTMRKARADKPQKLFEVAEVRKLADAAGVPLKAMILLAINCGFGNTDLAGLELRHIDLGCGWLDYPRPKTGIARRCPLWPETIEAIKDALDARPEAKDKADADAVFITKYGLRWVRGIGKDAIAQQFNKLCKEKQIDREGVGFYAIRHTFRTIADEVTDRRAIDRIMGHQDDGDIATHYVERIDDSRLIAVSNYVRTKVLELAD